MNLLVFMFTIIITVMDYAEQYNKGTLIRKLCFKKINFGGNFFHS